ncbi:MAG: 5-formyltetrahydrofolate cyclo-ligase [Phycisphaerales bacterium]
MDQVAVAKKGIRDQLRRQLAEMTPDDIQARSTLAVANLFSTELFRHASTVMLYMPIAGEVDTTRVFLRCFQSSRAVCVPKVDWEHHRMWPVLVRKFNDRSFVTDRHGLRMPDEDAPTPLDAIDLVIVPGLGFDTDGGRLGRGGGYYDRFLAALGPTCRKVGLCFDSQVVDRIPRAAHDQLLDVIVTDRRVIRVEPKVAESSG